MACPFFFFFSFLFHLEKLGRIRKHSKKPSPVQLGAKALRLPSCVCAPEEEEIATEFQAEKT